MNKKHKENENFQNVTINLIEVINLKKLNTYNKIRTLLNTYFNGSSLKVESKLQHLR